MVFELLNEKLRKLVENRFRESTEIQKRVIPVILRGDDTLVIAGTGMGKTEACMLPIFSRLIEEKYKPISVLYITPLRSLNRDMFRRLFWWADKLELEIAIRHGDTLQRERAEQRETPPDILITTPETLQAILPGKKMRKHLSNIKFVVIDEIHEVVSSKRGTQLAVALERLRMISNFQLIGLSATIGSERLVSKFFGNMKIVKSEQEKKMDVRIILPKTTEEHKKLEDELLIDVKTIARIVEIINLIKQHKSAIVFTNTRQTAEILSSRINMLDQTVAHDVHHSSLSKNVRIKAEKDFKEQKLKALIATSSLELGIDIGTVDLIIQYLSPRQVTKLVQRVGRSGHKISEISKGVVISDDDSFLESLAIVRRLKRKKLEKTVVHEGALDVLAHQIIGFSLDQKGLTIDEIYRRIKNTFPYRNLKKKTFLLVISFLSRIGIIRINAIEKRVYLRKRAWEYYFGKLSTIPDTRHYKVINVVTKEYIGNLDESFVAEYCTPENSFVFKGSTWRVVQTVDDKVFVEPTTDIESAIPSWQGELIPVHYGVTSDVGRLMKEILENKEIEEVSGDYDSVKKLIKKQSKFFIPGPHEIWIEHNKDFIIIHSFFGSLINETLGMYISSFLTSKYGTSVKMKTNPYSIIIKSLGKPEDIVEILHQPRNLRSMIIQSLEESNLFKWRFIQVAKRFGVMERNVSWNDVNINKIISYYRGMPVYDETIREIFTDKLDLENTRKILEKIKKGEINFFISRKKLSPLGRNSLLYQFSGYLTPKEPKEEIFKFFKRRLLNKTIMIVCMNCYDFKLTTRVKDVEETPECPLCGSRLIGVATRDFDEIEKILRKMKRKGKLNRRERKMYEELRKSANLVITYGHKAIMTLAAHGVGPEQAARILAKIPKNEEELLKLIFKAEKTFIRTHKYWR